MILQMKKNGKKFINLYLKQNMMNDNDITIKPFDDAQLEIESDNILKKDIEKNS